MLDEPGQSGMSSCVGRWQLGREKGLDWQENIPQLPLAAAMRVAGRCKPDNKRAPVERTGARGLVSLSSTVRHSFDQRTSSADGREGAVASCHGLRNELVMVLQVVGGGSCPLFAIHFPC